MQRQGGRVEIEGPALFQCPVMPAALSGPAQQDHVVGEDATEGGVLQQRGALGRGGRLGMRLHVEGQVAHRVITTPPPMPPRQYNPPASLLYPSLPARPTTSDRPPVRHTVPHPFTSQRSPH